MTFYRPEAEELTAFKDISVLIISVWANFVSWPLNLNISSDEIEDEHKNQIKFPKKLNSIKISKKWKI